MTEVAERSSILQSIQIGVEATPGTSVAANRQLQSLTITPNIKVQSSTFRPVGAKFKALSAIGKEWIEAGISGRGTYSELVYPFSSLITGATPTTTTGATTWVFTPLNRSNDAPKTFTVEHGSAVRADRFSYGLVTDFSMKMTREAIECTGTMLGQALQDGITMTASPTFPTLVPILPTQVTFYLDTTSAGLGGTKMSRVLALEWTLGTRFGPVWVLDAANPSFVNHVEIEPDLHMAMTLEADSNGMNLLNYLRSAQTLFGRIQCIGNNIPSATQTQTLTITTTNASTTATANGPFFNSGYVGLGITGTGIPASTTIASVTNNNTIVLSNAATATGPTTATITAAPVQYSLTIDQALKISDTGGFSDSSGVYAVEFTGVGVFDSTWGKVLNITVVNDVTAL